MRDDVMIQFGGRDCALRPTFEVADIFESRFQMGLAAHLSKIIEGMAPVTTRAVLLLEGLKAGDPDRNWQIDAVKRAMFDRGLWHPDLITVEAEFIERLMYTPEQYQRKKAQEKADQEALSGAMASVFSSEHSPSPLSI